MTAQGKDNKNEEAEGIGIDSAAGESEEKRSRK